MIFKVKKVNVVNVSKVSESKCSKMYFDFVALKKLLIEKYKLVFDQVEDEQEDEEEEDYITSVAYKPKFKELQKQYKNLQDKFTKINEQNERILSKLYKAYNEGTDEMDIYFESYAEYANLTMDSDSDEEIIAVKKPIKPKDMKNVSKRVIKTVVDLI